MKVWNISTSRVTTSGEAIPKEIIVNDENNDEGMRDRAFLTRIGVSLFIILQKSHVYCIRQKSHVYYTILSDKNHMFIVFNYSNCTNFAHFLIWIISIVYKSYIYNTIIIHYKKSYGHFYL